MLYFVEIHTKKAGEVLKRLLVPVTARLPVIGYDKAPRVAHYAADNDLKHKEAALKLGFVTEDELDHGVELAQLVKPYVTNKR